LEEMEEKNKLKAREKNKQKDKKLRLEKVSDVIRNKK